MSSFFSNLQRLQATDCQRAHRDWLGKNPMPPLMTKTKSVLAMVKTADSICQLLMRNPSKATLVGNQQTRAEIELELLAASQLKEDGMSTLFGLNPKGRRVFLYHQLKSGLSESSQEFWNRQEERIRKGIYQEDAIQRILLKSNEDVSSIKGSQSLSLGHRIRRRWTRVRLHQHVTEAMTLNWGKDIENQPNAGHLKDKFLRRINSIKADNLQSSLLSQGLTPLHFKGPFPNFKSIDMKWIDPSELIETLKGNPNHFDAIVLGEQKNIQNSGLIRAASNALGKAGWMLTWSRWEKLPSPKTFGLEFYPETADLEPSLFVNDLGLWRRP